MSTFAVLLLCIQACLVQNVFCQYLGCYGPEVASLYDGRVAGCNGLPAPATAAYGYNTVPAAVAPTYSYAGYPGSAYNGYQIAGLSPYGGAGEGNVGVAGELPVAGNTAVAGQVPIMGAVGFNGAIPAGGAVSIAGNCACGCNGQYYYQY